MQIKNKNFLSSTDFDFKNKTVLLRIDCDVDLKEEGGRSVVDEDFRLKAVLPTIRFLQDKGCKKIILLGHIGRPEGKPVADLSLKPVADWFADHLDSCQLITDYQLLSENVEGKSLLRGGRLVRRSLGEGGMDSSDGGMGGLFLLENLRFDPREKANDKNFVAKLASHGDVYVNDAFGVSHREHASIVGLPRLLPSFLGLRFEAEIKTVSWVKKQSKRPLVFVLGGSKKGKLENISFLTGWVDQLLVGGKLPALIEEQKIKINNRKVVSAKLKKSGKDLIGESIEEFKQIIKKAKTIIWAGPMGVYEETENRQGTFEVATVIAEAGMVLSEVERTGEDFPGASFGSPGVAGRQSSSEAVFKLAGGGDTHRVLSWTNLWDKFDFVSVGGGALLQFLKDGTLPGIKAIGEKE